MAHQENPKLLQVIQEMQVSKIMNNKISIMK
jgi:hypothetical protein